MMFLIKKLPQICFMWISPAERQTVTPYQIEEGASHCKRAIHNGCYDKNNYLYLTKLEIQNTTSEELWNIFPLNGFIM